MRWRQWAAWTTVLLCLSGGPILLAVAAPPSGWRFAGGLASPDDVRVYLAAMYQGARGAWLYRPPFDPTPAGAMLMYTLYLALGRAPGLDLMLWYHLARLAAGVLVLIVAAHWAARLFPTWAGRWSAWLLVAFSSGMGWLLALIPVPAWQARLIDLKTPETSTFLSIFTAPHFALGVALEALALLLFWQATRKPRWWMWAFLSGGSLLGLGLVYPFTLPVVYATMGGYVLWTFWQVGRRQGWRALWVGLIGGGITVPFVIYYIYTFFFTPFWQNTHVAQNVIPTPGPGWLLAGYGLPLGLAVWGAAQRDRRPRGGKTLLIIWAVANGLLLFLPVTFQWRMANGWHFCLALLAADGLEHGAIPWLRRRGGLAFLRRWSMTPEATARRIIVLLTVPSTLMVSLIGVRIALTERGFPYYVSQDELRAMDTLSPALSFGDVVLGAYQTGNVLPAHALCRVVVGQQFATLKPVEKLADVTRFFDQGTPDAERIEILERYGVTVVYYGPWERALGTFDPGHVPYLEEMVRLDQTTVYRVLGAKQP